MKVLVTGAAGFLGSHVLDSLIARGDQVIGVDHHRREKMRFPNPQSVMHKVGFEEGVLDEVFSTERPDAERNVINSLRFLRFAEKYGVKKFIFAASGGAMYGDHPVRPTPLLSDAHPVSPYGVGKLIFERYLDQQFRAGGVPYVSLRYANLYGPRQQLSPLGEGNVVSLFLDRLITGKPITIFGDGTASRDYLYVHDAVDAIMRALVSDFSGTVNVSTGRETTVRELFDTLIAIHGKEHPLAHEPFRPGEVYRSVLAYDSAREKLGWEPRTSLRDGLQAAYDWYMENVSVSV